MDELTQAWTWGEHAIVRIGQLVFAYDGRAIAVALIAPGVRLEHVDAGSERTARNQARQRRRARRCELAMPASEVEIA